MLPGADPRELGYESVFFDLPGLGVHAAAAGPTQAPLVLLLHGFPEGWLAFEKQIGPLAAAGYRLHSVLTLSDLLDYWERNERIPAEQITAVRKFMEEQTAHV